MFSASYAVLGDRGICKLGLAILMASSPGLEVAINVSNIIGFFL